MGDANVEEERHRLQSVVNKGDPQRRGSLDESQVEHELGQALLVCFSMLVGAHFAMSCSNPPTLQPGNGEEFLEGLVLKNS